MPKISVIIPVFNTEYYLRKCISSVISQTLEDIEIIILNDGSSDRSDEVIREFLYDKRIKYISHDNIGLGPTRNVGISNANGEFLAFIDSDDYVSPSFLEELYKTAKINNSDIACGNIIEVFDDGFQKERFGIKDKCYDLSDFGLESFITNVVLTREYYSAACDKIYKRSLVEEYQIKFGDNKIVYAEDLYFHLQILNKVKSVSFNNQAIYYYYQRPNSITKSYKENLSERHTFMIEILLNQKDLCDVMLKWYSLNYFDFISMEAKNIISNKKGFIDYYSKIKAIYIKESCHWCLDNVYSNKAYKMEPKKGRRTFIRIISYFLKNELISIATFTTFLLYRMVRRNATN